MLKTKLPSPTSYEDLEVGMAMDGFIVKVTSGGVVVAFYNDVKVSYAI